MVECRNSLVGHLSEADEATDYQGRVEHLSVLSSDFHGLCSPLH